MIDLLKISVESKIYSLFLRYPDLVFTPMTVSLSINVSKHTAKRTCSEFVDEDKIERVKRGYYKLKKKLVTA